MSEKVSMVLAGLDNVQADIAVEHGKCDLNRQRIINGMKLIEKQARLLKLWQTYADYIDRGLDEEASMTRKQIGEETL